jgi:hypothetical protein
MSLTSGSTPSRVYRSVGTFWGAIALTVGGAVFLVVGVTGGRGRIAAFVIGALLLLAAWRMWVAGIRVDAEGVTVGTFLLSRRVSWQDVDRFAVMPLGRYPYVGFVVLRDGRKFGTFGLATSVGKSERKRLEVQRPIDELNQIHAERQAISEATQGRGG